MREREIERFNVVRAIRYKTNDQQFMSNKALMIKNYILVSFSFLKNNSGFVSVFVLSIFEWNNEKFPSICFVLFCFILFFRKIV